MSAGLSPKINENPVPNQNEEITEKFFIYIYKFKRTQGLDQHSFGEKYKLNI